jgi:hypothetical protein
MEFSIVASTYFLMIARLTCLSWHTFLIPVWHFGIEILVGTDPGHPRVHSCSALVSKGMADRGEYKITAYVLTILLHIQNTVINM